MPPALPRIVIYHQTHHSPRTGAAVPLTPLLTKLPAKLHRHLVVIVGAVHLNAPSSARNDAHITLNDDHPSHDKFLHLRGEIASLQAAGVTVIAMLGGAALGSFTALDVDGWTQYYDLLSELLVEFGFDGVDLDVEEEVSLAGIVRLIRRIRADFGHRFLITLAPVATALQPGLQHMSGFDYSALEREVGDEIAWYNAQFYCGWGHVGDLAAWARILGSGWDPRKVVAGTATNPANAGGFVDVAVVVAPMATLAGKGGLGVGGVMGWEYFNALPGDETEPWRWVLEMAIGLGLIEEGGTASESNRRGSDSGRETEPIR